MDKPFKPHDIVIVDHAFETDHDGGYKHYGEVISHPIGETIMVRMVPGDCRTMREIPIAAIKHPSSKPIGKYIHYAVVSGSIGGFPIDMLRYDFAAPVNFGLSEDEMGRVEAKLTANTREITDQDELIVAKLSNKKNDPTVWTSARWASFGWTVKPLNTLTLEKI